MSEVTSYLVLGECREAMAEMPAESVDAVVTDPPYGLSKQPDMTDVLTHWLAGDDYLHNGSGFMGKSWDSFVPGPSYWREAYRVLKPGGHMLVFGGSRTFDLLGLAIRLAGFEIRDTLTWLYGSGFPKSANISKHIDRMAGADREVVGTQKLQRTARRMKGGNYNDFSGPDTADVIDITAPATDAAKQWDGWGTALKPAYEPIILARKPLAGTVAANVLTHGTGALNIDGCRIESDTPNPSIARRKGAINHLSDRPARETEADGRLVSRQSPEAFRAERHGETLGRWPANVVLDEESARHLDAMSGELKPRGNVNGTKTGRAFFGSATPMRDENNYQYGPAGGASRFFTVAPLDDPDAEHLRFLYCAKSSRSERNAGLAGMPVSDSVPDYKGKMAEWQKERGRNPDAYTPQQNHHPTVKPLSLMRWLVKLVTPPGGVVLDPFMGSGTTGAAAQMEGMQFVGIEQDAEYCEIAERRIAYWKGVSECS